jgi:hypothetical protein
MRIDDFFRFYNVYRRCGNSVMISIRLARHRLSDCRF